MIHVYLTKNGVMTGEFWGFTTEEEAKERIDVMRNARDNDPVWILFKEGNYDWKITAWDEEIHKAVFIY